MYYLKSACAVFICCTLLSVQALPATSLEKCNELGGRVANAIGGLIVPVPEGEGMMRGQIEMAPPLTRPRFSMGFDCGPHGNFIERFLTVNAHWLGSSPPPIFWSALSGGGAVLTQDKAPQIFDAIKQCVNKARASKHEIAVVGFGNTHVECQSFVRDGGTVSVTIALPRY